MRIATTNTTFLRVVEKTNQITSCANQIHSEKAKKISRKNRVSFKETYERKRKI